jgi:hypothetical protein
MLFFVALPRPVRIQKNRCAPLVSLNAAFELTRTAAISFQVMPDKTLKQIDVLRHELKALRYILDNFHAGKLPPAALPPREDFLSAQAREICDIILKAPTRDAAEARIAEIRLDDVDVASFLRLTGDHYYTYPALVHERAEALRAGRLRIEAA